MRITIRLFIFLFLVVCFSCEEQGLFVHCPDCTADEPVIAELEAKLEFNNFQETTIRIYEGNLDDGVLLATFKSTSTTFRHKVSINKKYTVTATYLVISDQYVAVDSAIPRVKYDKNQCNDPCYFVYDRIVDLRLKNIKFSTW